MLARSACLWPLLATAMAVGRLTVDLDASGSKYAIQVDGSTWFKSGPLFTTVSGKRYAAADGSLVHETGPTTTSGSDPLGSFSKVTHTWMAGSTPFETAIRTYASMVVFSHTWPKGASDTAAANVEAFRATADGLTTSGTPQVSSCFPSISTESSPYGFLTFSGRFLEGSRAGALQNELPGTGPAGGPFAVFGNKSADTLVFSAASNFMEASWGGESRTMLCGGLMSTVVSVPAGYSMETMVFLGSGVNRAVRGYGQALMAKYATTRSTKDETLKYLGFSTDNGAFYYYHTEPKKTYEDTLLDVHKYSVSEGIPYKHVLLDSWWYTKGKGAGVKEWDATSNTFPHGLESFRKKTGWSAMMHNRMWSNNNVYAKQNGGSYNFILEDTLGIPNDQRLWDDLIANKTSAGLTVYEQDWMYNEFQGLNATLQSATLSDDWLTQMGNGADKSGVAIQYCMSFARMVIHSVQVGAVTQFRAGDDYHPGQTGYFPTKKDPTGKSGCRFPYCVYYIGTTSILAWSLDLAPAKDNFWSTPIQPTSPYGNDTAEPYGEMEAAISALSTGPVQPSDAVGHSNASLIMMTCTAGGRLLQPSAPARAIDACFLESALGGAGALGPVPLTPHNHAVMATHTEVSGWRWLHALVIGLAKPFDLKPSHVIGEVATTSDQSVVDLVAWSGYGARNVTVLGRFGEDSPLKLEGCGYADFGLVHVAPVFSGGIALLGEVAKFVPVAVARVQSVSLSAGGALAVHIAGEPDEHVELAFASGKVPSMKISYSSATIGADGTAVIRSSPSLEVASIVV